MKNLTTPQAVLGGLALIALAVASIPYSSSIVTPAHANEDRVQKVAICNLKPTVTPIYQTKPEGFFRADYNLFVEKLHKCESRYIAVRDLLVRTEKNLQKCMSR